MLIEWPLASALLTDNRLDRGKYQKSGAPPKLIRYPATEQTSDSSPGEKAHLHHAHHAGPAADQSPLGDHRLADEVHVVLEGEAFPQRKSLEVNVGEVVQMQPIKVHVYDGARVLWLR